MYIRDKYYYANDNIGNDKFYHLDRPFYNNSTLEYDVTGFVDIYVVLNTLVFFAQFSPTSKKYLAANETQKQKSAGKFDPTY